LHRRNKRSFYIMANPHQETLISTPEAPGRLEAAYASGSAAVASVHETAITPSGYLSEEFIAEREGTWVPRTGPVWLGCSDEGKINQGSAQQLRDIAPGTMDPVEGYVSVFGQLSGIAKNVLVAGMTEYGPTFFEEVGGFAGVMRRLRTFMEADTSPLAVRAAAHSDRTKELAALAGASQAATLLGITLNQEITFQNEGLAPTGCAYNGGVGATSAIIAGDRLTQDVIGADIAYIFGRDDDRLAARLAGTHLYVAHRLGENFAFTRQDYRQSGLPVMVLERDGGIGDKHLPANETGVIINLDPEVVGNATAAGAYRMDIAGAALLVRRALPELNIPPKLLMAAFVADAVAVRTVLAAHDASGDPTADPRRLAIGVRGGTVETALAKIAELERQ
jgi:hypothetical protein